jgi:hypothetical protein
VVWPTAVVDTICIAALLEEFLQHNSMVNVDSDEADLRVCDRTVYHGARTCVNSFLGVKALLTG